MPGNDGDAGSSTESPSAGTSAAWSDGSSPNGPAGASPDAPRPPHPPGASTRWIYTGFGVVAVAVVVVVVLALVLHHGSTGGGSSSATTTLAPAGWASASLGYEQFADITFIVTTNYTLTGGFITWNTIDAFVMNNGQLRTLVNNYTVSGYEWTSGVVWSGTINYTGSPGDWNLVFLNTNEYGSSGVGISTDVNLTKL